MNDLQQQVQQAIDGLVESGAQRGLQVAVYWRGDLVVDTVVGLADPATGRLVTPDTPFYAYSVGNGATVAHVLVERGEFDHDTRFVGLWPEFGAHGKEKATIRHALTHTVGWHAGRHHAFIAGPNAGPRNALGDGGMRIYRWVFDLESWRERQGLVGGQTNRDEVFIETQIHLAPILLDDGVRLFDHPGTEQIELERTRVIDSSRVTHYTFRVVKDD